MKRSKSLAKILELPLEVRAHMAFKAAVSKVVEEHARLGLPLHLWRGDHLVEVSAAEVQKAFANGE